MVSERERKVQKVNKLKKKIKNKTKSQSMSESSEPEGLVERKFKYQSKDHSGSESSEPEEHVEKKLKYQSKDHSDSESSESEEQEENILKHESRNSVSESSEPEEQEDLKRKITTHSLSESDDQEEKKKFKPKKRKREVVYNPEEEERLEKLVFGDPSDVLDNIRNSSDSETDLHKSEDIFTHKNDVRKSESISNKLIDSSESDNDSNLDLKLSDLKQKEKVAWVDEDDEEYTVDDALSEQNRKLPSGRPEKIYKKLLENKFAHIVGTPKWAKKEIEPDSDGSDQEILKHSNHILQKKSKNLPKGIIDIKVLSHINKQTHTEGPFVSSVQFHESSTVALAAGSSGILSLFEIDGRENNKLCSVKFQKFPIHTARFLRDGNEILVGSMSHAHCHSYDLITGKTLRIPLPHGITNMKKFEVSPDGKIIAICGRLGDIHLLSSSTKELIGSMKMNKKCRSLVFTPDSQQILSHGESNEIYVWDVKSRACINRAFDNGCLSSSTITISPNAQYVATGSKQGVVNIYNTKSVISEKDPQPLKMVLNLVTSITKLKFNPTSEILAMASDRKPNAFKMVHLPSFHVFSNFPTFQTKMHNPLDIDFSPGSGYMGVSNNRGYAYLYRLKHYGNY